MPRPRDRNPPAANHGCRIAVLREADLLGGREAHAPDPRRDFSDRPSEGPVQRMAGLIEKPDREQAARLEAECGIANLRLLQGRMRVTPGLPGLLHYLAVVARGGQRAEALSGTGRLRAIPSRRRGHQHADPHGPRPAEHGRSRWRHHSDGNACFEPARLRDRRALTLCLRVCQTWRAESLRFWGRGLHPSCSRNGF